MPLTKLRQRAKRQLYQTQPHHQAAHNAKTTAVQSEELPTEWQDFETFCCACKTRQRGGIKGLELYPWQRSLMQLIERERSVVICKSRQVGGSQSLLLRALWRAIHEPGFMGLIASKSFADAQLLARRMRRALQGLPGIEPVNDSLSHLVLPNDSQILFRSSSPADGLSRGVDALSFVLADEYSFWDDAATAMGSLGPAMAQTENPELIIVSTPNGKVNDYWRKLTEGMGADKFEHLLKQIRDRQCESYQEIIPVDGMAVAVCHWSAIPAYADEPDFLGRMQKQFGLSEGDIRREFELNFEESAESVFAFPLVRNAIRDDCLQSPQSNGEYFAGVDPSGPGSDYSVAIVLKREGEIYRVVKMYRRRSGTSQMHIAKIADLIDDYQPVNTVVETNSIGSVYLENLSSACPASALDGFYTSQQRKESLIGRLLLALEREHLQIPEGAITEELLVFQRLGKKLEAGHGHDDAVIALALALQASGYGMPAENQFLFGSIDMSS